MRFCIEIENVHPITALKFEINLACHGIHCIVGKNGAGKTTLAKAIMNFSLSDTFLRTSSEGIFSNSSIIRYKFDEEEFAFTYDTALRSINTKKLIAAELKKKIVVELPAPYGQRFTFFRTLANADDEIRRAVVLEQYKKPHELIEFLSKIYDDNRFENLVEIKFRGGVCCCIVQADKRYIREDYFSSGEYFLINLYRKLSLNIALVIIDEIDIALDASAQSQLAKQLRLLCKLHKVSVVFTSHSLALMQTLEPNELYYLGRTEGKTLLTPMSFNAVKGLMFGFKGWDKYILTEDYILNQFIEYLINRYCRPTFFSYQIIPMGGGGQAIGQMKNNWEFEFLGHKDNVITILDGDINKSNCDGVYSIPLPDIEKALWDEYKNPDFPRKLDGCDDLSAKDLYRRLTKSKTYSQEEIFEFLCERHEANLLEFSKILSKFLCRS
jgi:ABC-type dipeptide/oligopeptide/nickel transport system ATPase component